MAGTREFAEVFFDGARVPVSAVLGDVNARVEGRHEHAQLRAGRRGQALPAP